MNLEQQLYDIYPVWYTPWWHQPIVYNSALVLGLLIIGGLGYWLLFYFRRKRQLPTSEWAQQRFNTLEEVIDTGDYNGFYKQLTAILKTYFTALYEVDIMSKTDQEVVVFLNGVDFPAHLRDTIDGVLRRALFVKFANAQAAREGMLADLAASRQIIAQTAPQDDQEEPA